MRVLLIEDNEDDALIIRERLSQARGAPFDLVWADRLSTGLERLATGGINVILLDLGLPDSRGLETLGKVHAEARDVPIVVLTGLADETLGVKAVQDGAQDYLVKGQADGNLLVRAIRYAIERKRAEEELAYMATHDALTGLPNRWLFNDRLNLEMAHAHRNRQKLAVMLLDLDHFKDVNDTLGHSVGDKLLRVVGDRLTGLLRKSDTVARMGGDEFMMILPEMARGEYAARVAAKILEAFREPVVFDGHELCITTSIGVAMYPDDGEDVDTLMKNADIAMYRAKEQGRNEYQRY